MSDRFLFDMAELNTLAVDLAEAGPRVLVEASKVVRKTAFDIAATAQTFVPVDTGATRSSIGVDTDQAGLGATIGPTTHYAPYLEFGTSRMAPRAFMGPALDKHTPEFLEAMAVLAALVTLGPGI